MIETINPVPEYCRKNTLVLGCGNLLFGDDGFGPEVISHLQGHYPIPEDVMVMDAGTGVREILLDVALSETKPKRLILVDALDSSDPPGTLSLRPLDSLPPRRTRDFSPHLVPTSLLLKELAELGRVEVLLLTVQPLHLPEEVQPGLSPPAQEAVPRACEFIVRYFGHA